MGAAKIKAVKGRARQSLDTDVVTLAQANAVMPLTPPHDATSQEKNDFYRERAEMYRRVARTDMQHHWEALACAWLEQEKADTLSSTV